MVDDTSVPLTLALRWLPFGPVSTVSVHVGADCDGSKDVVNAGAVCCADAAPAPARPRTAVTATARANAAQRACHDDDVRVRRWSIGMFSSQESDDNVVRPSYGCNVAPASDLRILRHGLADVKSGRAPGHRAARS